MLVINAAPKRTSANFTVSAPEIPFYKLTCGASPAALLIDWSWKHFKLLSIFIQKRGKSVRSTLLLTVMISPYFWSTGGRGGTPGPPMPGDTLKTVHTVAEKCEFGDSRTFLPQCGQGFTEIVHLQRSDYYRYVINSYDALYIRREIAVNDHTYWQPHALRLINRPKPSTTEWAISERLAAINGLAISASPSTLADIYKTLYGRR